MTALGRVHVELSRIYGQTAHLEKAKKLAHFFRNRIVQRNNNSYSWEYWPKPAESANGNNPAEDVTHAQINVHFACLAYQNGIVFDETDMKRFSNTLTKNIMQNGSYWAENVDGKGKLSKISVGFLGWIIFSEFNTEITERLFNFVQSNKTLFPLKIN